MERCSEEIEKIRKRLSELCEEEIGWRCSDLSEMVVYENMYKEYMKFLEFYDPTT